MRPRARLRTAKPLFAIVICTPFVIKPVAVPPAEIVGVPRAVTMGPCGAITVFSHRLQGFTPNLREGARAKSRLWIGPGQAPVINTYFLVYIYPNPDRALVTFVRHKTPYANARPRQSFDARRR